VDLYIHSPIRLHGVVHRDNFTFTLCLIHVHLTSVLDRDKWSASRFGRLTAVTHWIGSWMTPEVGLGEMATGVSLIYLVASFKSVLFHTNIDHAIM
jgi:hypothetical protein